MARLAAFAAALCSALVLAQQAGTEQVRRSGALMRVQRGGLVDLLSEPVLEGASRTQPPLALDAQPEVHPSLTTYTCDASGDCTPDSSTSITLDGNWRWTHQVRSLER